MKALSQVRQQLAAGQFEFSRHAFRRTVERNIGEREIREAGAGAEVIENYPDDKYSPGGLLLGCLGRRRPGGVKQGVFAKKAVFGPKNDFSNFEIAFSNFEIRFSKLENGFSNFESALSKLENGFSKSERAVSKFKNAGSKPESVFSNLENGFSSPAKRPCIPRRIPRKLRSAKNEKERGVLQNAVDSTDRKTDDIVYDIYALTPEKIGLVEGTAK